MLAAAALLASCSQDDALQSTVNTNEGLKPMTITASLPTDGMQTRAAGDAAAARCYVSNGDSFTTTVYLNGSEIYNFLFWADTEATDAAAPADLRAVAYTNGETIAWAGKIDNRPWTADDIEIELNHVVSRVTVMTESGFTVSETWPLTVTVPTVFRTYNVETEEVTGQVDKGYTFSAASTTYDANAEVGHFYVLGDGNNQSLKLWYYGPKKNPDILIIDVPVSANTHITLKGDIYNAGMVEGNIKATTTTGCEHSWCWQPPCCRHRGTENE